MKHTGGYEVRGNVSYQRNPGTAVGPRDLTSFPLVDLGNEFLRLIEEDKYPTNEGYGVYGETDDPKLPMQHVADCDDVAGANHLAKLLHDHWEIAQWVLDSEPCLDGECAAGGHIISSDQAFEHLRTIVEIARESYQ